MRSAASEKNIKVITRRFGSQGYGKTPDYHANATIRSTDINTFAIRGQNGDFDLINEGTITADGTNPRGALVVYGGQDTGAGTASIVNTSTGVINGNVLITDANPLAVASTTPGANVGAAVTALTSIRDSNFVNQGTINGAFTYGAGTHVLDNSGTITGPIFVLQATAPGAPGGAPVGIGGASFTLTNSGTIGGDITIRDRSDSVNNITLQGTGFSSNVIATNGTGNNTLTLQGVTNLASVQNFTNLNLNRSNVAVPGGVSLVNNATIQTSIYGRGGTQAAPSTQLGTINGTLTLAGATTLKPVFTTLVRNGDVYQVASAVAGPGAGQITVQQRQTFLLRNSQVDTSDGRLLLTTQVRDPRTISGISRPAGATLQGLLTYDGSNPQVLRLGAAVERLNSAAAVRQAGTALSPITNGADIQIPINSVMLFHQQIDSRLDSYVFAQIPVSGRSADLGVARPAYGVVPPSAGWIEAIGGGINQGSVNGVSGYNAQLAGVIGGYDRLITPNIRVGGAFGYIGASVNGNGGRRENIQTYQGLVYGELAQPNYYLRGSVGYGGVDFQNSRQIAFPGYNDIAFGKHSGDIFTARGEGGVPFEYRNALLVPYAAFTYSHLNQNAFTEQSANGAALAYRSAQNNSERSEAGGKVIVPLVGAPVFSYLFPAGSFVALEARAAYVHEFGNVAQTVAASFIGGGNVFVAAGPVPTRDMIDYGVGLRMGRGPVQIDISYNGLARSTYLQQVGLLRARYLF